jgi:hypothetical protein
MTSSQKSSGAPAVVAQLMVRRLWGLQQFSSFASDIRRPALLSAGATPGGQPWRLLQGPTTQDSIPYSANHKTGLKYP